MSLIETDVSITGLTYDHLAAASVNGGTSDVARQLTMEGIGNLTSLDNGDLASTIISATYDVGGGAEQVFEGPVVRVSRSGRQFWLEANDYSHFGLAPYRVYTPFTIAASASLGAAVNRIAEEMGLTTSASDARTLKQPYSVERGAEPWRVIKDLCAAHGRIVYFDRTGALTIARKPKPATAVDWTIDSATELFAEPKITWDTEGLRTAVEVIGNQKCGDVVYGFAGSTTAPVALESIETEDADDETEADTMADDALDDFAIADVSADLEVMPNPELEPWWKVQADGRNFLVDTFTLNLNGTSSMTLGGHRRMNRTRRSARTRSSRMLGMAR